ncbi:hypothetical protein MIR68_008543 [Amoeboaphelidium protococcarum]|nr:hypothetical protein MIR68_011468 [Amoeboaphelidium protococcarum]KAI3633596.1 hypothetical protein MIR68_008543 [Amoeboaphelidium protococcarum]KAI3644271.1 hypothetical protein MP228_010435 [Amoeboaphelidium protococcarum]KAI3655034.1 hypothetical protein MP228_000414 [Amoeboaphelidium protococcarum]
MSELKLQKLLNINERLKQEEALERIPVSKASKNLVDYTKSMQDPLVKPSVENPFSKKSSNGGCIIL